MPDVTLSDICSEHRRRYPDRLAVIDGAKRYTWPQFDDRVNRAARMLADRGVGRGDRVLWLAQTSSRFLELMLACARIGAMICPANWRQSAEEFAFVIDDFDPKVIVWQDEEIGEAVTRARSNSLRRPPNGSVMTPTRQAATTTLCHRVTRTGVGRCRPS